ncbi:MAG: hypothetical protein HQK54_17675 [Oligoflexales bacterium]|nr:hypothetical protein [Oligoflexales bacterium]
MNGNITLPFFKMLLMKKSYENFLNKDSTCGNAVDNFFELSDSDDGKKNGTPSNCSGALGEYVIRVGDHFMNCRLKRRKGVDSTRYLM